MEEFIYPSVTFYKTMIKSEEFTIFYSHPSIPDVTKLEATDALGSLSLVKMLSQNQYFIYKNLIPSKIY